MDPLVARKIEISTNLRLVSASCIFGAAQVHDYAPVIFLIIEFPMFRMLLRASMIGGYSGNFAALTLWLLPACLWTRSLVVSLQQIPTSGRLFSFASPLVGFMSLFPR
jgi:hypothetical protein